MKFAIVGSMVIAGALYFALLGTVGYVTYHFVSKFW